LLRGGLIESIRQENDKDFQPKVGSNPRTFDINLIDLLYQPWPIDRAGN
jgi:hypothetical protein